MPPDETELPKPVVNRAFHIKRLLVSIGIGINVLVIETLLLVAFAVEFILSLLISLVIAVIITNTLFALSVLKPKGKFSAVYNALIDLLDYLRDSNRCFRFKKKVLSESNKLYPVEQVDYEPPERPRNR